MTKNLTRREFLQAAAVAGGAVYLGGCVRAKRPFAAVAPIAPALISPGCRKSKVQVAKVYMGIPGALWPTPKLDLNAEVQKYEGEFSRMKKELADVDFVVNELVTSPEKVQPLKERMKDADGVIVDNREDIRATIANLKVTSENFKEFTEDIKRHPWKLLIKGKEQKPKKK